MSNTIEFFCLYERFLALIAARLTFVSFCKSYKPSLPTYFIELIERKRYFAVALRTFSKIIRKELVLHNRQSWSNYCRTLNELDTRSFWKKTKRHFVTRTPSIEGFLVNSNIVALPLEMCAVAQKFYEEQFAKHENSMTPIEIEAAAVSENIDEELQKNHPQFPQIKYHHIHKAISSLKNKNSTGIDGVSNHILKLLPSGHLQILLSSFNAFASAYQTPAHWQVAKMVLLSKTKSGIVTLDETRPISLLPCFSKINEKCFLVHLRKWVDDQGILPEEQSGFRPGHNMGVRLVSMIDQIGQSLSKNTAAAALFVDFKSAFNQLWYNGL